MFQTTNQKVIESGHLWHKSHLETLMTCAVRRNAILSIQILD